MLFILILDPLYTSNTRTDRTGGGFNKRIAHARIYTQKTPNHCFNVTSSVRFIKKIVVYAVTLTTLTCKTTFVQDFFVFKICLFALNVFFIFVLAHIKFYLFLFSAPAPCIQFVLFVYGVNRLGKFKVNGNECFRNFCLFLISSTYVALIGNIGYVKVR